MATLTAEDLERQVRALASRNPDECCEFAILFPGAADIRALQEVILEKGNAYHCTVFAAKFREADAPALQKVVVASGSATWCYNFALEVSGADIPALQEVVLASGSSYWCHRFASDIRGADVLPLARVIAQSARASEYLAAVARHHPAILTPEVLANLSLGVTL